MTDLLNTVLNCVVADDGGDGKLIAANLGQIEAKLRSLPQTPVPIAHLFVKGAYVREVFVPKGTLALSELHLTEHVIIFSKGSMNVWTKEDGVKRIDAPYTGITKPGTQRLVYAREDTVVTTVHVTEETDVKKIEATIIAPSRYAAPANIG